MGARPPNGPAISQEVIADFRGEAFAIPPGVDERPTFDLDIPNPAWLSPVASHRLSAVGATGDHLAVGGRTVWVQSGPSPAAIVASHPNRLGSAEDVAAMVQLAGDMGATAHIEVDPFLVGTARLPRQARPIVCWEVAESAGMKAAASRARQGANALRRRLAQISGLMFPVEYPFGRTITVVLPIPAIRVTEALASLGTRVDLAHLWEGGLSMTVGWWHTRHQIDALAAAINSVVAETDPGPIPPDRFDRIPEDLPLRRLDTIPFL